METRINTVSYAQKAFKKPKRPAIRITGSWLLDFGFDIDKLVSVTYSKNNITFKLEDDKNSYLNQVKQMIKERSGSFFQVSSIYSNKKNVPHIRLKGNWLRDWGFEIGNVLVLRCDYGIIDVRVLNLEML